MEVKGPLARPGRLFPVNEPGCPLDRRLSGPQNMSGRCGEDKNPALPAVEPRSPDRYPSLHTDRTIPAPRARVGKLDLVARLGGGRQRFDSREGQEVFLRSRIQTGSGAHPASHPVHSLVYFTGVKRPQSDAVVNNTWSYTSTTSYFIMAWCYLSTGTTLISLQ
jgi:hypothetical protein